MSEKMKDLLLSVHHLVIRGRTPCAICRGANCTAGDPARNYCLFPHLFQFDVDKEEI